MGKRKRSEKAEAVAVPKKEDVAPERPVRTLLGWKDKNENENEVEVKENGASPVFRNKEKVLVTCSRRIVYRYKPQNPNIFCCICTVCVCFEFGFVYFGYVWPTT
jgi:hypothetical protein